jgi:hypothetical protein
MKTWTGFVMSADLLPGWSAAERLAPDIIANAATTERVLKRDIEITAGSW